jgi:hypothetical protein
MQFTSLFVSLLLSTAVAAKGNKTTKAVSDKSLCKEMESLTKLVDLASNTTELDAKAKNNATKVCNSRILLRRWKGFGPSSQQKLSSDRPTGWRFCTYLTLSFAFPSNNC